jgi:trans-2,3-dihydro-3-hydroxyanthranilate isomerase
MPAHSFVTTDVFTSQRFGGNQLAVFPHGERIDAGLMPRIAREFNFSETTFVLPPDDPAHTRRVRIFTPDRELPFAGHPTVGTAVVLAHLGEIPLTGDDTRIVFEEGVGPVPVRIHRTGDVANYAQLSAAKRPEFGPPPPKPGELARMLSLAPDDVLDGALSSQAVSCGLPYLFIPVRDRKALARTRVRLDDLEQVLDGYWTTEVFVFCADPELPGSDYRARMFAPTLGVTEDPATGSACAAFGGYLAARDPRADGTLRWMVEQGFEMGRPSLLEVEADKRGGQTTAVRVGGNAVIVTKGELLL